MEGDGERKERPRCARSGAEGIRAGRAPPAETANTPPTPLRRKDAQVQVRRSATKSKGGEKRGKKREMCGNVATAHEPQPKFTSQRAFHRDSLQVITNRLVRRDYIDPRHFSSPRALSSMHAVHANM